MIIILILEYSPEKEKIDLEKLLNNKGYAKSDFIIVEVKDYTISSDLYNEQQENTEEQNISENS